MKAHKPDMLAAWAKENKLSSFPRRFLSPSNFLFTVLPRHFSSRLWVYMKYVGQQIIHSLNYFNDIRFSACLPTSG